MRLNTDPRSEAHPNTNYKRLFNLISTECSEAISELKTDKAVFRGLRLDDQILKTNPRLQKRTSKNTTNYYTLLIDNLPSWRAFPKRSEILICTNFKNKASTYGSVFLFLPVNGAKFGVCPYDDIWTSKVNNTEYLQFSAFNDLLHDCNISANSYSDLVKTSLKNRKNLYGAIEWYDEPVADLFSSAKTSKQIEKIYDQIYDPKKLGFELASISSIPKVSTSYSDSNELWTDSSGYLIRLNKYNSVNKTPFFTKYIRPLNKNLFDAIK